MNPDPMAPWPHDAKSSPHPTPYWEVVLYLGSAPHSDAFPLPTPMNAGAGSLVLPSVGGAGINPVGGAGISPVGGAGISPVGGAGINPGVMQGMNAGAGINPAASLLPAQGGPGGRPQHSCPALLLGGRASKRILLVDDTMYNGMYMLEALQVRFESANVLVETTDSAMGALALLTVDRNAYCLVIVDIKMPDVSGPGA